MRLAGRASAWVYVAGNSNGGTTAYRMTAECPEVMKLDGEGIKIGLLKVYMETIFYRDVVERFRVRDVSSRVLLQGIGRVPRLRC